MFEVLIQNRTAREFCSATCHAVVGRSFDYDGSNTRIPDIETAMTALGMFKGCESSQGPEAWVSAGNALRKSTGLTTEKVDLG